ncbi:uncharacterized protein PRCAT00002271001 [Priceomyces carsonii]|uniref:uncharacterized protein n=1 Tax=Priceomyces carsonii TaxID=28549 RepID=UPI002ED7E16D|nr:unnamed protein product [Priceomyces carsonii]
MSQYIGKTISLISNKGLRYVGLLDNINADDATVALKSVRSFGTEGRMAQAGNPMMEVMPGKDIYGYVVFRGSDVKDLTVLDLPIDQVKPEPYYPPPPPAGYYAQQQPQNPAPTATVGPSPPGHTTGIATQTLAPQAASGKGPAPTQAPTGAPRMPTTLAPIPDQNLPTSTQSQQDSQPSNAPQTSSNFNTKKQPPAESTPEARPQDSNKNGKATAIFPEAFDFESANAKFQRDTDLESKDRQGYNKSSSFFDTISSSAEERSNMRWSEEKDLNLDTFGEASVGHRRGRGRGRGRGGRGNSRGRGNWRGRGRGKSEYKEPKPEWA